MSRGANRTTLAFLEQLYGKRPEGWLTLFALDRSTGRTFVHWGQAAELESFAEAAGGFGESCCVWWGVATRRERLAGGKRGGVVDCLQLPGLWVDLDVAGPNHKDSTGLPPDRNAAYQLLDDFGLAPSFVADTGGGLQAFWLFDQAEPVERVTELAKAWGRAWHGVAQRAGFRVDSVFNVDRIMRLPGTWNRKNGGAVEVTITRGGPPARYTPAGVAGHLSTLPAATEAPAAAERPVREPWAGPERPGDAYNATTDGAAVLLGLGWQYSHASGGDRHYTRPGKSTRDGSSATVYADGHTTIYSDTVAGQYPAIELRRPYDPFGLYTNMLHAGDYRTASDALAQAGYGTKAPARDDDTSWIGTEAAPDAAPAPEPERQGGLRYVNWQTIWTEDIDDKPWLIEPFIVRERAHVIYAPAKAGKSLVVLYAVAALACGRPIFNQAAGEPTDIIYLDYEMTEGDLIERLSDYGYGPDDDLSHLHYSLIPTIEPLDTEDGGKRLLQAALDTKSKLVVIDTTSRAIAGEENEADTIRRYYMHTGSRLKANGIAVLRLDHAGKDAAKGQRGTSAKNDDVDIVYRLTQREGGVLLEATHRRLGWVPERLEVARSDDPLTFTLGPKMWPKDTAGLARQLDDLDAPLDITVRAAQDALRAIGNGSRQSVIRDALRYRRERSDGLVGVGR